MTCKYLALQNEKEGIRDKRTDVKTGGKQSHHSYFVASAIQL
jgi:hypothetical protein